MRAALRLDLRHLATHRLRTLSAVLGIALGIAPAVATDLLDGAVSRGFARTVDRIAGRSALEVVNGTAGVAEELLDAVRAVPGVRLAAPSVQGYVSLAEGQAERLYLMGVDLVGDDELRDYDLDAAGEGWVDDPLVFVAQPDSVALTTTLVAERGLAPGARLAVRAAAGVVPLVVRAAFRAERGPASVFGGRVAVMDVFAAQRLLGLDRRFTQIDLALDDAADVATVEPRVRAAVAGRAVVQRPARRGEIFDRLRASQAFVVRLCGVLAVVIGVYVVFGTMTISVAQRRREIAVLRATGMTRRGVATMILLDATLLALAGAALGLGLGLALARAGAGAMAASVSGIYLPVDVGRVALAPRSLAGALALALGTALVAALLPAREAARVRPVEALRAAAPAGPEVRTDVRLARAGALLLATATAVWLGWERLPVTPRVSGSVALLGLLGGGSLLVPWAFRRLAPLVEAPAHATLGAVGLLASRSIGARARQLGVATAAFVASVAGTVAIATLVASLQHTVTLWLGWTFAGQNLMVRAGTEAAFTDPPPLPRGLVDQVAALPGVARVLAVREVRVAYGGALVKLNAAGLTPPGPDLGNLILLDGTPLTCGALARHDAAWSCSPEGEQALARLASGDGVVVNALFARRFGRRIGDRVTLPAAAGPVELPIVGVSVDMEQVGVIHLERDLYRRLWRDDAVSFVFPILGDGADPEDVARRIRARAAGQGDVFVMATETFHREAEALLGGAVAFVYPLIVLSIAVALLGVVNALLASLAARGRELGVLRAVGGSRRQVAAQLIAESGVVGLLGGALGVLAGSLLAYPVIDVLVRGILATPLFWRWAGTAAVFAGVAAVTLATAAGAVPGAVAARRRVRDALARE